MADRVGQQLGNYLLVRLLGRGGFAEVYLGKHRYLNSYAALKILRRALNDEDEKQFLAEAQTLVRLRHPHIVRVLEFSIEQGTPVLVMDYAPGGMVRTVHPRGSRLPLATIISYVKQTAAALQYAHNHHIIHRDVKPENILLDAEQHVLLSDFGLSLLAPSTMLLSTQEMAGTLPYTAPEQLRGKPCFASDQYALGIVTYEWLCGKCPFEGNVWEIIQQHQTAAPSPLRSLRPDLPPAVETVVLRALAKDPSFRFASVQAFAHVLERASREHAPDEADGSQITASLKAISSSSSIIPSSHPLSSSPSFGTSPFNTILSSSQEDKKTKQRTSPATSSNRQRLLNKVRAFWITGVLEQSLHEVALITLGLQERPDTVASPWQLLLQQPDATSRMLAPGTCITQVYDDAGGELLILGEPGSGKTTLLLELARHLLKRAEQDDTHPIPVVFNLSSWAQTRSPLTTWLADELNSKYQVPRKLAQSWITTDQILPLLDGLDEVIPTARIACVEAINAYRGKHGLLPVVVCSRSAEYLAQTTRILLCNAVVVQPLTAQQVDQYLSAVGKPLASVRTALQTDPILQELATTPLMLSVLTLAYQGQPASDLPTGDSPQARRHHIFTTYVQRMLQRRGKDSHYIFPQTTHWLSWLAGQLLQHNQTEFSLERIQSDWLPTRRSRRFYHLLVKIAVGLVFGLVFGLMGVLVFGFFYGPLAGLLVGLAYMLVYSLIYGLIYGLDDLLVGGLVVGLLFGLLGRLLVRLLAPSSSVLQPDERLSWSWPRMRRGLCIGLLFGLGYGLLVGFNYGRLYGLVGGLLVGLVYALVVGLVPRRATDIKPAEVLSWSWPRMRRGLLLGLAYGSVFGVLVGLFTKPLIGLAVGLVGVLVFGLIKGLSGELLDERTRLKPNQGIWRSLHHSVLIFLIVGLLGSLLVGLVGVLVAGPFNGLVVGLVIGLLFGLIIGLQHGGIAAIQHAVLRLQLWRTRTMPWNYPRFLDYAAERVLLRKVGGNYIFVHRLLLEYFAALNTSSTGDQPGQ